jgi:hypothetical protein
MHLFANELDALLKQDHRGGALRFFIMKKGVKAAASGIRTRALMDSATALQDGPSTARCPFKRHRVVMNFSFCICSYYNCEHFSYVLYRQN